MTVSGTTSRISLVACTLWLAMSQAHAVDLNSQDLIPAPAVPMPFWGISPTPHETALPPQVATKLSKAPGWTPSSASFVTSTTWMWVASPSRRRC